MKKIVLFVVFGLLCAGCGSVKVADRVEVEVRDKSRVDVVDVHNEQVKTESASTVTTDEYVVVVEETVTVGYDTEKPVDVSTGKPPVKSEVITKKTITKGRQVQAQMNVADEHTIADSTVDRTQRDVAVAVVTEHEETPQKSSFAYIYYIVLIVAIGAGVYFLNRKFGFVKKILLNF
jgi:hypothetical protein